MGEIEGLMVQMFHPVYLTDKFSIPPDSISSLEEARALAEAWSPFIMISYSTVAEYCAKRWKVSLLNKPSLPPLVQYQQPKTQSLQSKNPSKVPDSPKEVVLTKRQRVLQEQLDLAREASQGSRDD